MTDRQHQIGTKPIEDYPTDLQTIRGWVPRYLVQKAPGVEGPPISDDEPVLVIRAQDEMAPEMMDIYLSRYSRKDGADQAVIIELMHHRRMLLHWQAEHPEKVKRADRVAAGWAITKRDEPSPGIRRRRLLAVVEAAKAEVVAQGYRSSDMAKALKASEGEFWFEEYEPPSPTICGFAVHSEMDDGPLTQRCVLPAHGSEIEHRFSRPGVITKRDEPVSPTERASQLVGELRSTLNEIRIPSQMYAPGSEPTYADMLNRVMQTMDYLIRQVETVVRESRG